MAQKKTAPPSRIRAAGPLARTARPRNTPKRMAGREVVDAKEVGEGVALETVDAVPVPAAGAACCATTTEVGSATRSRTAAATRASVRVAEKSMSVEAAWEKPIIPTLVGSRSNNQRAVSAP